MLRFVKDLADYDSTIFQHRLCSSTQTNFRQIFSCAFCYRLWLTVGALNNYEPKNNSLDLHRIAGLRGTDGIS